MWLIVLLCTIFTSLVYLKILKSHKYWEKRGVPYLRPRFFFGNLTSFVFRRCSFADAINNLYRAQPGQRYSGFYQFLEPMLLIRDPELIKQITVKDFDAFPEHKPLAPEGLDSVWDKNLFSMKGGEKWHSMRSTLSPSFTSSKMKMMFPLIYNCAKQLSSHFSNQEGVSVVEMKDTLGRFANDVIASASFGVTCDSLQDRDNEIYRMGKTILDFSGIKSIFLFLYDLSPTLMKLFTIRIISKETSTFFKRIIGETISLREKNSIVRPDMIHLLMEAKKGNTKSDDVVEVDSGFAAVQDVQLEKSQRQEITDEDIVAQAIIFYAAGFDTSSTAMCFVCYELAVNPDVQNRLVREIKSCNGEITYEKLMQMKYLDMVISETLRKWPPSEFTDRLCTKDFTIQLNEPDHHLTIERNTDIWIPIYGLHRDERYYENPDKFDPERFSVENRNKIQPFTFLPFGVGPRGCIGSRFALLEVKLLLFELLSKFEIVPVEKTQVPLLLAKGTFGLITENGVWLGFKPRN